METDASSARRVSRNRTHTEFDPQLRPALTVTRGETVVVETQDCFNGQVIADRPTHGRPEGPENIPVSGPIYIDGADVGDVLCVHILRIAPASSGMAWVRPGGGILGKDIRRSVTRTASVHKDRVTLEDGIVLPLHPVIGNIGVAARHGKIGTAYPGRHGGNMDTMEVTSGSRVFLPVQVKGALLSLGDVKACIGDGQISGTGVEVGAEVTFRVDTLPGGRFSWPRVKTHNDWVTITSASTVEHASRLAVTEMIRWLEQEKGLDFDTAHLLIGLGGALRISQWTNPLVTARLVFPKAIARKLPTRSGAPGRTIFFPQTEEAETPDEGRVADEETPVASLIVDTHAEEETDAPQEAAETGQDRQEGRRSRRWRRRRSGNRRRRGDEKSGTENAERQDTDEKTVSETTAATDDATATPERRGTEKGGGDAVATPERRGAEKSGESPGNTGEEKPARRRPPRRRVRRRKPGSASEEASAPETEDTGHTPDERETGE